MMKSVRIISCVLMILCFQHAYADSSDLLDTSKIQALTKKIVSNNNKIRVDDLKISHLLIVTAPDEDFFHVEASLEQISTKRYLTEQEINDLMSAETNPHLQDHYRVTSYTVMFNSKNPYDASIIQGVSIVSKQKP